MTFLSLQNMNTPDLNEIRKDLEKRDAKELLDYCIRLAKFKKENKELFSFLLFDADDLNNYIEKVKSDTENSFLEINKHSIYYIKKSVRKILKNVNTHIRFSLSKQVEAELLIHFSNCIIIHSIPLKQSVQLRNLYDAQLKKIEKVLSSLHPDLQFDFKRKLL
jgi:hypothetical protein